MRKLKHPSLKAVNLTTTAPASFADYIRKEGMEVSEIVQRAVAQRVLGISFQSHWQEYRSAEHTREYKPEEPGKSYIRAARWILESDIVRVWTDGASDIWLEVDWRLTETPSTFLRVGLRDSPGFRHVIYDEESDCIPATATPLKGPFRLSGMGYKDRILQAWLNHSWRPERWVTL